MARHLNHDSLVLTMTPLHCDNCPALPPPPPPPIFIVTGTHAAFTATSAPLPLAPFPPSPLPSLLASLRSPMVAPYLSLGSVLCCPFGILAHTRAGILHSVCMHSIFCQKVILTTAMAFAGIVANIQLDRP